MIFIALLFVVLLITNWVHETLRKILRKTGDDRC